MASIKKQDLKELFFQRAHLLDLWFLSCVASNVDFTMCILVYLWVNTLCVHRDLSSISSVRSGVR